MTVSGVMVGLAKAASRLQGMGVGRGLGFNINRNRDSGPALSSVSPPLAASPATL